MPEKQAHRVERDRDTRRKLAREITEDLFTNGRGDRALRLVLIGMNGEDFGGWCLQAVIDCIAGHMERTKGGRRG